MSLSRVLFEGASVLGMSDEDMARYNYADGHREIYTETAMDLRDIFEDTYYAAEQVELAAIHDGTTVEESYEYQEIMEGLISDGFEKISDALKKLWQKILAFFSNIQAKLLSHVKDNEKFVDKFTKMSNGKLNLAGFKYKTWTFTNIDDFESLMDGARVKAINNVDKEVNAKLGVESPSLDDQRDLTDALARITATFIKDITGTDNEEDAGDAMWSHFHNGAKRSDNKEEVAISSLDSYLSTLKSSKSVKDVDAFKKATDKAFKSAKATIKEQQVAAKNSTDNSARLSILRSELNSINTISMKANSFISIWRRAVEERASSYRSMCAAAFVYSNRRK